MIGIPNRMRGYPKVALTSVVKSDKNIVKEPESEIKHPARAFLLVNSKRLAGPLAGPCVIGNWELEFNRALLYFDWGKWTNQLRA